METVENGDRIPEFRKAYQDGEIVEKSGHHQIDQTKHKMGGYRCDCSTALTGENNSYRHIKIRLDGKTIYYYHQEPVYIKHDNGTLTIRQPIYHRKSRLVEKVEELLPSGYTLLTTSSTNHWMLKTPEHSRFSETIPLNRKTVEITMADYL